MDAVENNSEDHWEHTYFRDLVQEIDFADLTVITKGGMQIPFNERNCIVTEPNQWEVCIVIIWFDTQYRMLRILRRMKTTHVHFLYTSGSQTFSQDTQKNALKHHGISIYLLQITNK